MPSLGTRVTTVLSSKSRGGLLIRSALAAVVTVGVVISAVLSLGGDNRVADTASESPTDTKAGTHNSAEAIIGTFPPALAESICSPGSPNSTGDLYLLCTVNSGSALAQSVSTDYNITFVAWVNQTEAGETLIDWRENERPELITENASRTAAARIEYRDAVSTTDYANSDSGLHFTSSAIFPDVLAAKAFLESAGLI
ncbi:hypothetical protein ACFRFQ_00295 [Rhodococcus sp. NPDC056743]|uniref:hypothetical protein n=1 Tax=Rhodococcus sp. NPDC056743 TaxID=3345934 RepID=UPI00366D8782